MKNPSLIVPRFVDVPEAGPLIDPDGYTTLWPGEIEGGPEVDPDG